MKDVWHDFTKFVDHYRYTFIALLIAVFLIGSMIAAIGCQSQVAGLTSPEKVTRTELDVQALAVTQSLDAERAQLEAAFTVFNAKVASKQEEYNMKVASLEQQDKLRADVFTGIVGIGQGLMTQTMTVPEAAFAGVGILGALFGVGATLDNKRKDKVIIDKSGTTAPPVVT
jgi:hypothetical protein